jgi:hypothetical protein
MDTIARDEMVKEGFDATSIEVTGHPHFDYFADEITKDNEKREEILFVSQPISSTQISLPFNEFSVLKDVTSIIDTLPLQYQLGIRLHPKEDPRKFDSYISSRVLISNEPTLEEALSRAGLIIGMVSPVLIQAALAGKSVLSYQPEFSGTDMMVSNRVGVTRRVGSYKELQEEFNKYVGGILEVTATDIRTFWPQGATERVIVAVMKLLPANQEDLTK